ncbi:MAG TPA: flagellar basal body L-ring protein FlgH, partial [Candidatus Hydrogenedentes bacterium]|nr:flagellar basal body L-ring protein FlgH [Candidatus Hydrogenedentota bacterium]
NKRASDQGTLISNKKPDFKIGDIITVQVVENIDASTEADTHTKKDGKVGTQAPVAANPFLISEGVGGLNIISSKQLPNWDIKTGNEHKATGSETRANKLITTVSCLVEEVMDSGNLRIAGAKRVTVNREDSKLLVRGTIRARDVRPGNTILSSQIANAEIELKGQGSLWNNQRRGIITRILDWFSPF